MKFLHALLAAGAPLASARFFQKGETDDVVLNPYEEFLIETAPGETQWVTEDEKWELRRNGQRFMDITATRDLGHKHLATQRRVEFPKKCVRHDAVRKLVPELDKKRMRENLQKLTSFHTRYYNSDYGRQSSEWLLERVSHVIKRAGAEDKVTVRSFPHTWKQSSVIATIPGKSNSTIVIGAHQDSINLWLPILAAPGADDDGSGTVTIMEVFAALLASEDIVAGKAENTIEFHWYSAEEGGLLGSQAIFKQYEHDGRDVKAMLQQDMTGYSKGTLEAGLPESVGVIIDYVDAGLTKFIKLVVQEYCRLPWVETKCGYACSDHASASKAGYPSAFVIESLFDKSSQDIHTTSDTLDKLSFDHMLEHAKMTLGFVYELALHDFAS
ncbi:Leucine aminopeptidase 1 [Claviceps africana]|uniref:Peptide hydrolase n=1 Tax=Claviceps africana TaxID=83212 RepID=A0A8K0NKZ5_9HYPO|nr:Leucine aminopeptidase 1 [Claviceps africana]